MNVIVNGEEKVILNWCLQDVLEELGYGTSIVATAINSEFVPASIRHNIILTEGDQLEILAPMQGG